jgi:PAS domain S-box-containing protein
MQRRAQAKAAEQRRCDIKTTLDFVRDGVFVFEPETLRFTYVNQGAVAQIGYDEPTLLNMHPFDIKPDFDEVHFRALLGPLRRGELSELRFETRCRHRDGHDIPVEIFMQYLAPTDQEARYVSVVRDIAERKAYEDRLAQQLRDLRAAEQRLQGSQTLAEQASQAKSAFLARMTHELRTPLNSILGFAQVLANSRREPLSERQAVQVRYIEQGGRHLLDLIDGILELVRMESEPPVQALDLVELDEVVRECLDAVADCARKRGIELCYKPGHSERAGADVRVDHARFRQVLLQLLSNAVKYNRDGGRVLLIWHRIDERRQRLDVCDTGPGIAPEHLDAVFEPFNRLDADRAAIDGTGIGLALARARLARLGGCIGVDSFLGQGCTFWIEWPLMGTEPVAPAEPPSSEHR